MIAITPWAQQHGQNPHCLQSDDNEMVYLTDFALSLVWCA